MCGAIGQIGNLHDTKTSELRIGELRQENTGHG